ncbi:MAG TPA: hypothetical protein VIK33_09280 [Anaerolineae bacterium]
MTSDFYGLPVHSIGNEHVRLEFLAEAGPRIVRMHAAGSENNLLAEMPDMKWMTPYGEYHVYGGHRLWHAPEVPWRTYVPDEEGLEIESLADGVRLRGSLERPTGLRKSIDVHLDRDQTRVTLVHRLVNEGTRAIECAPWAITQLPLGGVAILPQPSGPLDADGLQPNRILVVWPYTHWNDPRLHLHDDFSLLHAEARSPAIKIGYSNRHGWIGYLRAGVFFRKRFEPDADRPHPDFGSNVEVYCDDRVIELETLAPLRNLEPGQSVTHIETWDIFTGLEMPPTLDGVRMLIQSQEKNK